MYFSFIDMFICTFTVLDTTIWPPSKFKKPKVLRKRFEKSKISRQNYCYWAKTWLEFCKERDPPKKPKWGRPLRKSSFKFFWERGQIVVSNVVRLFAHNLQHTKESLKVICPKIQLSLPSNKTWNFSCHFGPRNTNMWISNLFQKIIQQMKVCKKAETWGNLLVFSINALISFVCVIETVKWKKK